jgi:hypothetical protein
MMTPRMMKTKKSLLLLPLPLRYFLLLTLLLVSKEGPLRPHRRAFCFEKGSRRR